MIVVGAVNDILGARDLVVPSCCVYRGSLPVLPAHRILI